MMRNVTRRVDSKGRSPQKTGLNTWNAELHDQSRLGGVVDRKTLAMLEMHHKCGSAKAKLLSQKTVEMPSRAPVNDTLLNREGWR